MAAVTTLADPKFEGRAAGSPGGIAARAWIVDRFKAIGLQPVSGAYVHPFTFTRMTMNGRQDGEGANVLGMCLGTDPKLPFFVVSAHYDHLGIRDGQIYPGADDDASGVAVIARAGGVLPEDAVPPLDRLCGVRRRRARAAGREGVLVKPPVPKDRIALERQSRHGEPQRQARDLHRRHVSLSRSEGAARRSRQARADHGAVRARQAGGRSPAASRTGPTSRITARSTRRRFRSCISASRITPITTSRPIPPTRSTAASSSMSRKPSSTRCCRSTAPRA